MNWTEYHELYGEIYRFNKKHKESAAADSDGITAEAELIYEKYGKDSFVLNLIEAVMKDLFAENRLGDGKGWQVVLK